MSNPSNVSIFIRVEVEYVQDVKIVGYSLQVGIVAISVLCKFAIFPRFSFFAIHGYGQHLFNLCRFCKFCLIPGRGGR